ncbi:gluconolactonase [Variovorax sp. WS11]|nr:SMP-30/gluconolactonase/LRE family protein [Variovorax sp. WS11]NDZ18091.1 SMP-30/gluconolactonase/LRE family protein [Variovorax sp. WS11]PSL79260.1 gluconolactonase [Variovorax sp. WS11]
MSFSAPHVIDAQVLTQVPAGLRRKVPSEWAQANKPGHVVDCFIEGPCFDRQGNLYLTDIPHGRIFRVTPELSWQAVAETGGWPNGIAVHRDGTLWVADYRRGLLRVDPASGAVDTILGHRNSESFKGLNDLVFDRNGDLYFTDQGQTGLHDPTGRVYRLRSSGQLDLLIGNAPSPNGVALDVEQKVLFVAVTRGNAIWRAPLLADGSVSKVGAFRTFFGTSGPDGLCVDQDNRLVVAHASLGGAFVLDARGEVTHFVRSPNGSTVTNAAFRPGTSTLVMTESQTGSVLQAELPAPGAPLFSHA